MINVDAVNKKASGTFSFTAYAPAFGGPIIDSTKVTEGVFNNVPYTIP